MISSGTADKAEIIFPHSESLGEGQRVVRLDRKSYARMKYRSRSDDVEKIQAKVSVFNPNTFNGRLFVPDEERTIPFYLTHAGRSLEGFELIADSYSRNLVDRSDSGSVIGFEFLPVRSKLGMLVKYTVIRVYRLESWGDDDFIDSI